MSNQGNMMTTVSSNTRSACDVHSVTINYGVRFLKRVLKALIPRTHLLTIQSWLRALPYVGLKYTCPCCGWHLRKMFPFGFVVQRENAQCPRCGSLERHRLLWLYLQNRTNLFSAEHRLLHVAPEPVLQQRIQAQPDIHYVSVDLDSPLASIKMDLTAIPHSNQSFDVILCSHVLEHIEDDRAAMRELFRVLKPGGWAILQSPIDHNRETTFEDPGITSPEDRLRFFNQQDHVRVYGRDYKDRLEQAGFTVCIDRYIQELGEQAIIRYSLDKNEDIYFCSKAAEKVRIAERQW